MKSSQKKAIAVGAGLAAVAAAAAGVYFFTGKNAKNRKKVAKWATDMQEDVIRELNKAKKHTKASYDKVVDQVSKNYKGLKNVSAPELTSLAKELKTHWDIINAEVNSAAKSVRKVVPKAVKSVAKKVKVSTVKKSAKKVAKKRL